MNLANYIKTSGRSPSDLAADIGVSTMALRYWISGKRIPRPDAMTRIVAATDGMVQPNDFFPPTDEAA